MQEGEEDPLARYVHPPLVKTEPIDRRQHGHPERIGLESVGGKKTGNEGQYLDTSEAELEVAILVSRMLNATQMF
jgi:hypothetical protein